MNGPDEPHGTGPLRDPTAVDWLSSIVAPTLLMSRHHDETTPATVQPFADLILNARWTVFPDPSHMPRVEERQACMDLVGGLLKQND